MAFSTELPVLPLDAGALRDRRGQVGMFDVVRETCRRCADRVTGQSRAAVSP